MAPPRSHHPPPLHSAQPISVWVAAGNTPGTGSSGLCAQGPFCLDYCPRKAARLASSLLSVSTHMSSSQRPHPSFVNRTHLHSHSTSQFCATFFPALLTTRNPSVEFGADCRLHAGSALSFPVHTISPGPWQAFSSVY